MLVQGNINWMASRQGELQSPVWHGREADLLPLVSSEQSDSANLDAAAELLLRSGEPLPKALMVLVPEAYENHPDLDANYPEVKDFYHFYEGIQEGWDGPALLVFSDGNTIGARLDRNGLRPARFWRTKDDVIYVASEVGVLDDVIDGAPDVVLKGRLGPGQMVVADLTSGTFKENTEIAREVAMEEPYGHYLARSKALAELGSGKMLEECTMDAAESLRRQAAAGYGLEDTQMVVEGMAQGAVEPTYCMGDDNPLAVLSDKPHMLYTYFKQRFAQVRLLLNASQLVPRGTGVPMGRARSVVFMRESVLLPACVLRKAVGL
jgi:glutamate synthase (ferredoxin)